MPGESRDRKLGRVFKRSVLRHHPKGFLPSRPPPRVVSPDMESLCIICLNLLPTTGGDVSETSVAYPPVAGAVAGGDGAASVARPLRGDVAHLQHCRHTFHDHCISMWIEVVPVCRDIFSDVCQIANTCPACRATFNQIDVSDTVDGKYRSYTPC